MINNYYEDYNLYLDSQFHESMIAFLNDFDYHDFYYSHGNGD